MQLMPDTAKELGVSDPFDVTQNINGGTKYLADLIAHYKGDLSRAFAAYNAGRAGEEKGLGKDYARKVLAALGALTKPHA